MPTATTAPATASRPKGTSSSPSATEILDAIAPLLAHHRRGWAARCQAHGISIAGFQVLALLEMDGPTPMGRLADELGVALPNATGIAARMADRGLIQRSQDPSDRRVVLVSLTVAGRGVIEEMEAARRERMTRLLGELDNTQQRRLLQAVRDLHAAAERLAHSEEPGA